MTITKRTFEAVATLIRNGTRYVEEDRYKAQAIVDRTHGLDRLDPQAQVMYLKGINEGWSRARDGLAEIFMGENPRFDRERFMSASDGVRVEAITRSLDAEREKRENMSTH